MIAISSHPTVRPENGGRHAAKLQLSPKLKIAQTAAKSHIFAFFRAFLVRRKTGRKMHGFAAVLLGFREKCAVLGVMQRYRMPSGNMGEIENPCFSRACIVKWRVAGNNWRMPENSNYRIFPGASRRRCRECPIIPISNRSAVRPENGGRHAAKLQLFPKLKIAQITAKSHIFAFFRAFLVRRKTGRKMHGFAAVLMGFRGKYAVLGVMQRYRMPSGNMGEIENSCFSCACIVKQPRTAKP